MACDTTSFMGELFVYQCRLATIEEYLEIQTKNLNRYFSAHGRRFHSLETSGFNAWDVLYKLQKIAPIVQLVTI